MARRYGKAEIVRGGAVPYEIDETLSVGAFAVSYAARKPDGTRVFLKQYKSPSRLVGWYRPYIDYQQELKRRVQATPTLVSRTYEFVDFFEADKAFIQVFGFISGGKDLRKYLGESAMSLRQRWEFATLFLLTLQRFHDAGIVHTDLKPENIYLMPASGPGGGWNVKLIDFDFTVLSGWKAPWDGQMGYVGTPRYLSPEHLRHEVPETGSDVFTAALICRELLCVDGHPYPEDEDAYREAALSGRAGAPRFIVPETPELHAFGSLLSQALSPVASDRPSAGDLSLALRSARDAFWKARRDASTGFPAADTGRESAAKPSAEPAFAKPSADPVPETIPSGAFRLVGPAGATPASRVDLTFGKDNLAPAIGEDAQFANTSQFRIHRKPGEGGWWISLAGPEPKNPPLVDGVAVSSLPTRLENGSRIVAASSRTKKDVRKGEMAVQMN